MAEEGSGSIMVRPSMYDPRYCERVIELGKTGASIIEMATEIGVSRNTLALNWTSAHPDFRDAFEMACQHSQVWWERKGRENMENRDFQSNIWSRSMAARFPNDWRETSRNELTGAGGGPIESRGLLPDLSGLGEAEIRLIARIGLKGSGVAIEDQSGAR